MNDVRRPDECVIDQRELGHIKQTVDKISGQMDHLISMDGPISAAQERLALLEGSVCRVHERVDKVEEKADENEQATTAIMVKVASVTALIFGGLWTAVMKFLGGE